MEENMKIGISRCRLFEFENCVSFTGCFSEDFSPKEITKALKMLAVREPVITSVISLNKDSEAHLETEKAEVCVDFIEGDAEALVADFKKQGIDFTRNLFKFYVINKNVLVILSHTIVSDSKSLLILAEELVSYYKKETVSVVPRKIKLFSDDSELPVAVQSFVADRVTEVLDNDWLLHQSFFSVDDYKKAKASYDSKRSEAVTGDYFFSEALYEELAVACEKLKIDFSSAVMYFMFKALKEKSNLKKKQCRINAQSDRRVYFVDYKDYMVGPFNGTVSLELPKKSADRVGELCDFHKDYYKKLCLCFNAFYNEVFLSKLSPSFLDSAYMYKARMFKCKPTEKLAKLYLCEQQFLMSFSSVNLNQQSWEKLSTFNHIMVTEPHKSNEKATVSLVISKKNCVHIEYEKGAFSGCEISDIFEGFEEKIKAFLSEQKGWKPQ